MATIEDFQKLDIRVGKVINVEDIETKKPMYKLEVDFGVLGKKQAIAGVKPYYKKGDLLNKKFIFVVNLEPKRIGNILSECMILAACEDEREIVLIEPEKDIEAGTKIS